MTILYPFGDQRVAFSLADAQAAVMERVNDQAQHQPTRYAILWPAPCRGGTR